MATLNINELPAYTKRLALHYSIITFSSKNSAVNRTLSH